MKVQYKYNKNNNKETIKFFIFIVVVFFIFYFFSGYFFSAFLGVANFSDDIKNYSRNNKELVSENLDLKAKLEVYEKSDNLLYFYMKENEGLQQKLGYKELYKKDRKIFNVINSGGENIYSSILVNDKESFAEVGDLAFYKFNMLIGKVAQKNNSILKINLFSSIKNKNDFYLYDGGEIKMKVSAVGQGSGIILAEVPRKIKFKNDSKIFLADINNDSYLVAVLVDQEFKTQDTHRKLYFKIFTNPALISQLEIEKQ